MMTTDERVAQPLTKGWRGALVPLGVAGLTGVAVAYVAVVDPNQAGHYPTCPFYWLTGLYCPGCGSLRAVHALAHGHVGTALSLNPLTMLGGLLVVGLWVAWLRRSVTGRPRVAAPAWLLWVLLGVVLAFWVLRNLPGFGFLAP